MVRQARARSRWSRTPDRPTPTTESHVWSHGVDGSKRIGSRRAREAVEIGASVADGRCIDREALGEVEGEGPCLADGAALDAEERGRFGEVDGDIDQRGVFDGSHLEGGAWRVISCACEAAGQVDDTRAGGLGGGLL